MLTNEEATWILECTYGSIRAADAKSAILAAIFAGFVAVLLPNEHFLKLVTNAISEDCGSLARSIIVLGGLISSLVAFFSLLASFYPRTKCSISSEIYYGRIAEHKNEASYKLALYDERYCFEEDVVNQIYVNSCICSKKMKWNKAAGIATCVLVFLVLALCCFSLMGW